ncbi:MAG: response regulator [Acidimicrobiales bacterium]
MSDTPRLRVVVAEDDAIIRMDLCQLLDEVGYDVVADCGQGDVAIDLIREHRPDAAVLDVKMPGLDGISAASVISGERLCAVVLLTAFSQRTLIESARDAGVMAYLVKPFQRDDLVPAIELAVGRFAELVALAEHSSSLEEQLAVRKLSDRAKARLMAEHSMTEDDAFRFLQRTAMDRRESLRKVAEDVLSGALEP